MSTSETACLACALQHNDTVRFLLNACLIAAASLLAGCSSPNQQGRTAPVWEDLNTVVQPSPVFPIAGPVESDSAPVFMPKAPSRAIAPSVETWVPLQRWIRASGAGTLVRLT